MRKVVLFIASSLDGYIARTSGDVDWLFTDQDYGYADFLAGVDTVIMGRRTYEQALSFGEYPYKGKQGFVFSRTRKEKRDEHVAFISGGIASFIEGLKKSTGKNIWLVGGSEVIHSCMSHDLIDEFVISVHPIILGDGIPLFRSPLPMRKLSFRHCKTFDTGLVQLTYVRHPAPESSL
ncbi:MAG: dihydrofolate reductase family protein [Candidatus Methanoperedens sp.]|nr:dihydrofolate reductase family protein [Candidatus Methanoperedens sp.]